MHCRVPPISWFLGSVIVSFLFVRSVPAFARYMAPTGSEIQGKCGGDSQTTCMMKEVENVTTKNIPQELKTANCGYPLPDIPENDKITLVKGLPIIPFQFRDTSPSTEGAENGFPDTAKGFSFAYGKNPDTGPAKFMQWCSDTSKDKHPCHVPDAASDEGGGGGERDCETECHNANRTNSFAFDIYRHTWCWKDFWNNDLQKWETRYEKTEDQMTDCDSCNYKDGWHQVEPGGITGDGSPAYAFVDKKWICTSDYRQQVDVGYNVDARGMPTIPFKPKWIQLPENFQYVKKDVQDLMYGWVWDDKGEEPKLDLPNQTCKDFWRGTTSTKGAEEMEHPNCVKCEGSECRTDPPIGYPYDPMNGTHYSAFFRRYEGSHVLQYIEGAETREAMGKPPQSSSAPGGKKKKGTEDPVGPGYQGGEEDENLGMEGGDTAGEGNTGEEDDFEGEEFAEEEPPAPEEDEAAKKKKEQEEEERRKNSSVKVACYGWYKEPQNPTIFPGKEDLNCVADDLRLDTILNKRKMTLPESALPVRFNLKDKLPTPPKDAPAGGYSLEAAKKTFTWLFTPIPPKVLHRPPFGETPWYVTEMRRLEQQMKDYPPTVQVILPTLEANDQSLGTESTGAASSAPLIDMTVPLEPGLIEVIRDFLHQSILSRLEEQTIPVVLPLLSEEEIQSALQAWETWKKERLLTEKVMKAQKKKFEESAGKADQVIAKLQEYRGTIHRYRILRAMLPEYLAYLLQERRKLTDALDDWIKTRMDPYTQALGEREQMLALLWSWKRLEYAYTNFGAMNSRYCKADTTTPPLPWLEAAGPSHFSFPDIPSYPRHMVFDFSDIFFEGTKQIVSLPTPVLELVRVSLNIPMPPPPDAESVSIPQLPSLPKLPDMPAPAASLIVQKEFKPAPEPPPFPYEELTEGFDIAASMIDYEARIYNEYLWVKSIHRQLTCKTLGSDGCVFPETYLWHVFMRIWSPIGVFLKPYPPPDDPDVAKNKGFMGYASSLAPDPPCAPLDDQCQMRELLVRGSLRITLPASASSSSSVPRVSSGATAADRLRSLLRLKTIDKNGALTRDVQNLYNIFGPQDLYDAFPVPLETTLDFQPPR